LIQSLRDCRSRTFEPATCRSTKGLHGLGAEGEWTTQQLTQPSTTRFGNQDHHKILETEHKFTRIAWSSFCITCGCRLPSKMDQKKGFEGGFKIGLEGGGAGPWGTSGFSGTVGCETLDRTLSVRGGGDWRRRPAASRWASCEQTWRRAALLGPLLRQSWLAWEAERMGRDGEA